MSSDRDLGMFRPISRRQFCQGTAVALGASLAPWAGAEGFQGSPEIGSDYYPPALTGLRGAHKGSFETAHALAREGKAFGEGNDTGEPVWDLVVTGGGISGLAAAWFYRQEKPGARILVLDCYDDFGGHAKRNEFTVNGQMRLGYGGSQSIDTPASYSPQALHLLKSLHIDLPEFYQDFDQDLYSKLGLQQAFWLDKPTFGVDRLVPGNPISWGAKRDDPDKLSQFAAQITTNDEDGKTMLAILQGVKDPFPGLSKTEKVARLRSMSYDTFLQQTYQASDQLLHVVNPLPKGLWGCGTDAISARETLHLGFPGFDAMGIQLKRDDPYFREFPEQPYIFHFPDGNASIARLMVRQLCPDVAPGGDMHDIVTAHFDYSALDRPDQPVCIRVSSTVIHIGDTDHASSAQVRYVKNGKIWDVRARNVIYAGYARMFKHVCPAFPPEHAAVFDNLPKIPLLYANMLVKNWQAFIKQGVTRVHFPGCMMDGVTLDFPVSIGDYRFNSEPDQPTVLHWQYVPTAPWQGLDAKAQSIIGRQRMLGLNFEDYERAMRSQMADALGPAGFDPAGDILAITVNRWPHGYAYEYNDLIDPPDQNRYQGPHVEARRPFGRVSMAGTDSEAFAYVNGAVDAAWRAVQERLS